MPSLRSILCACHPPHRKSTKTKPIPRSSTRKPPAPTSPQPTPSTAPETPQTTTNPETASLTSSASATPSAGSVLTGPQVVGVVLGMTAGLIISIATLRFFRIKWKLRKARKERERQSSGVTASRGSSGRSSVWEWVGEVAGRGKGREGRMGRVLGSGFRHRHVKEKEKGEGKGQREGVGEKMRSS